MPTHKSIDYKLSAVKYYLSKTNTLREQTIKRGKCVDIQCFFGCYICTILSMCLLKFDY